MGGSGLYFYKAHFSFVKLQTTFSLDSVLKNGKKKKKKKKSAVVGRPIILTSMQEAKAGEMP